MRVLQKTACKWRNLDCKGGASNFIGRSAIGVGVCLCVRVCVCVCGGGVCNGKSKTILLILQHIWLFDPVHSFACCLSDDPNSPHIAVPTSLHDSPVWPTPCIALHVPSVMILTIPILLDLLHYMTHLFNVTGPLGTLEIATSPGDWYQESLELPVCTFECLKHLLQNFHISCNSVSR